MLRRREVKSYLQNIKGEKHSPPLDSPPCEESDVGTLQATVQCVTSVT